MNRDMRKSAIHFALVEVDFRAIVFLAQKTNNAEIVSIIASGICVDDLDVEACNKNAFAIAVDDGYASVTAHKHVKDPELQANLLMLQEMKPEELSIIVSEATDANNCLWEIIIMYYEDIVTVCYDKSIRKKDAVKRFRECFRK